MTNNHACILPPLAELQGLLGLSETEAKARIAEACLRQPLQCPRCFGRETFARKNGRCGCRQCGCAFDLVDGRWMSIPSISARSWLILIKCFELGLNVREASRMAGVPRSTAYRAFRNIRLGLAAQDPVWAADPRIGVEALISNPMDGFLNYLRNWTARYRGMSPEEYPLYVKECQVRFEAQGQPLFERLLACVAAAKPIRVV
ncbi:MAG: hypothetical protein WC728_16640 [Elusimicrobiota bacterium]